MPEEKYKVKNVIKNVIKGYFPQIYRVCFLEFSFLKLSNIFDIFKNLNSRKSILQLVKFLILHNSISWTQEIEFNNLNVPCRLWWYFTFEYDDQSLFTLVFTLVCILKMLQDRIQCHQFLAFFSLIRNTVMNQVIMQKILTLIVVTSLSGLENSILEHEMCMTKIMGFIWYISVNFEIAQNLLLLCNPAKHLPVQIEQQKY